MTTHCLAKGLCAYQENFCDKRSPTLCQMKALHNWYTVYIINYQCIIQLYLMFPSDLETFKGRQITSSWKKASFNQLLNLISIFFQVLLIMNHNHMQWPEFEGEGMLSFYQNLMSQEVPTTPTEIIQDGLFLDNLQTINHTCMLEKYEYKIFYSTIATAHSHQRIRRINSQHLRRRPWATASVHSHQRIRWN